MGLGLLLFLLPFIVLFLFLFLFLQPKPIKPIQPIQPKTRSSRQKLPPGTVGLPFIGETLKLIAAYKTENPEPFIAERVRRYGRLFTTHVFGERTVFSADPDFNRLVLRGEGRSVVECSYPASICTLLGQHSLLLMPLGSLHKRLHSLTLTLTRHSLLLPHIDHLVTRTMAAWGDSDCSTGEGEAEGEGEGEGDWDWDWDCSTSTNDNGNKRRRRRRILLLDQAKQLTFDLTVKQLLSIDPGPWTEALRREYVLLIDAFFSVPLPSFLAFSFTAYGRAIKARKKVAEALRQVIREKMEERSIRIRDKERERERERDMVDTLLDLDGESSVLSEEEMVDFLLALLIAGYETTSTSITLAVKFLTDNPSALALLRDEHDKIRAHKGHDSKALDWTDYKSMPFTQCVISETLRVANIVSGVFRRAVTDIDYKGYTIPKGCKIFASFRAVHMDEEYFKSAAVFDPWRWQSTDTFHQQVISAGVFTPFGGGARLCPGFELARVVISVFLHHLVTRFSWEAAEEDRLVFFPTTRTSKGYPIFVRARTPTPTPTPTPTN